MDAIAAAGATVVPGWPEGVDPGRSAEAFGSGVGLFFAAAQPGEHEFAPLSAVIAHEERRAALRAAWARYFAQVDVLVCRVNLTAAFPHDDRPFERRTIATDRGLRPYTEQPFWTAHAALPGLPALAAPVGQTPVTFAELLADVTGGYPPPPVAVAARAGAPDARGR